MTPPRSRTLAKIGGLLLDRYHGLAAAVLKAVADADQLQSRRASAMSAPFEAVPLPPLPSANHKAN